MELPQEIPKPQKKRVTIFDIAGFPHYETVMSNCYAYFLNKNSGEEVASIFLESLLQIVHSKYGKSLDMEHWEVETEVRTEAGNRIDILISGKDADSGKSIIIENKIYHHLNNDLIDYWNYCEGTDSEKIGIVLSLSPVSLSSTQQEKFINILHSEWMKEVANSPAISSIPEKTKLYVEEFVVALDNLKTDSTMNEPARFYFQNIEKVNELIDTHASAREFALNQFRLTAENLNLNLTGSAYGYRYFEVPGWPESNIFYTIMYDNLFTASRTIRVVIEIMQRVLDKETEYDKIAMGKIKSEKLLYKSRINPGHWVHYVGQDFSFDENEIENLGTNLANKITEHLHPIFLSILPLAGWSPANNSISQ